MAFLQIEERIESVSIYKKVYGYKIIFKLGNSINFRPRDTYKMIREEIGRGKYRHHHSVPDMYYQPPRFTIVCRFLGRRFANEKLCEMKLSFGEDKLRFYDYWFVRGPRAILKFFYHFFFDSWR